MSWCVYKHTSPSGKVYIGISSNISIRWSRSGFRYTTYNSINITDGGEGTLGRKVSEKTKEKIRKSAHGFSEKARMALLNSKKRIEASGKTITIAQNVWRGSHHTKETIKLLKQKAKGRDMTKAVLAQAKKKAKKVLAISSTGDRFIFNSRAEASSYIGSPVSNISRAIQHSYKVKNYKLYNYAD